MKKNKIQIYINGKKKNINIDYYLIDILQEYCLKNKSMAIEINQEVVPKSKYKFSPIGATNG